MEEEEEKETIRTIRCHLSRRTNWKQSKPRLKRHNKRMVRCKGPERHFQVLETMIKTLSLVYHRQSLLMNGFLVRLLSGDQEPPIMNKKFFRQVASAACGNRRRPKDNVETMLYETADDLLASFGHLETSGLSQVVGDSIAEQYYTNFTNYCELKLALGSHIKGYLRAKYGLERKASATYIYVHMWRLRYGDGRQEWVGDFPKEFVEKQITPDQVAIWVKEEERILYQDTDIERVCAQFDINFEQLEYLKGVPKKTTKVLTNVHPSFVGRPDSEICKLAGEVKACIHDVRYTNILKYRHYMLSVILVKDNGDKMLAKRFTMAPVSGVERKFIRFDNAKFHWLQSYASALGVDDWEYTSIEQLFNRYGLMGQRDWDFLPSVQTNGVELHVRFTKKKCKKRKRGRKPKVVEKKVPIDERPEYQFKEGTDQDKLRFVDPGLKQPVASAKFGKDEEGNRRLVDKYIISQKEYHERAGHRQFQRFLKNNKPEMVKEVEEELAQQGSLKEVTYEDIKDAIFVRMCCESTLMRFYGSRRVADRKFHKKNRRTEYIHEICDKLTDYGETTVVFGDGGRHTGIRGCDPGGCVKEIIKTCGLKRYSCVMVGEGMSSRVSYCCGAKVNYMYRWEEMEDGTWKRSLNGGICHCTACHCTLSRDVNSAGNIGLIALAKLNGRPRPESLVYKKNKVSRFNAGGRVRLDTGRDGAVTPPLEVGFVEKVE